MRRRRYLIIGTSLAVVLVLLVALWPRPQRALSYVTAPVSRGDLHQQLTLVGPVERSGASTVEFSAAGMVTAVNVQVGDTVSAGQALASIDPADLRLALLQARARLTQTQAQLDSDLAAQKAGSARTQAGLPSAGGMGAPGGAVPGGGTTPPSTPGGGKGSLPTGTPTYVTAMNDSLAALQVAVKDQQKKCTPVFEALQRLKNIPLPTALPTSSARPTSTATAPVSPSASPSTTESAPTTPPSPTDSATASPAPSTTATSATPTPSLPAITQADLDKLAGMADQVTACSDALGALATAEGNAGAAIATAAQGLSQQTQQAMAAVAAAQANLEVAARQASEQAMKAAQAEMAQQMAANFGATVTDATIASDRAAVLQAQQGVDRAETDLSQATITSPISGVVGALSLTVGESSAGKSATIVGPGAVSITVNVPLADRPLVAAGVAAQVGHLATRPSLTGTVASIGVLPATTGSQPAYPTRLNADDPGQTLPQGSYAQVSLDLARATDVLTVPMSAVTKTSENAGTVQVAGDAYATTADTVTVATGRQGDGRIEITSGLREGQLVVLADRRLPVPGGLGADMGRGSSASPTPTPSR